MMSIKPLPKGSRGTLFVLATVLVASGVVRLSGEAGLAVANEIEALVSDQALDTTSSPMDAPPKVGPLLQAIQDREARVIEQEAMIAERLAILSAAEERVEDQIRAMKEAEERLRDIVVKAREASENDVGQLTAVYENMKPKDAAVLFEQMDSTFAAGFLARMNSTAAANIMSGLTPEKAYAISVVLAGRNAELSDKPG